MGKIAKALCVLLCASQVQASTADLVLNLTPTLVFWSSTSYSVENLPVTKDTAFCHGSRYPGAAGTAEFWCKRLFKDGIAVDYFFLYTKPVRIEHEMGD